MAGAFIVFEGQDGSGKTTQIKRLADLMTNMGLEVVTTREPGGTNVAEKIRGILLDPSNTGMTAECEAYLYAASRAEHTRRVIMPALERGAIVLCDRYLMSSLAYQGYGRGLGAENIRSLNAMATGGLLPDLTFYFSIAPKDAEKRMDMSSLDRIEQEGTKFYSVVDMGYIEIARNDPKIAVIDASLPADDVWKRVLSEFNARSKYFL